jgi:hypothetical protein
MENQHQDKGGCAIVMGIGTFLFLAFCVWFQSQQSGPNINKYDVNAILIRNAKLAQEETEIKAEIHRQDVEHTAHLLRRY